MRNYVKRPFKLTRRVSILLFLSILFLPMDALQERQAAAEYHDYAALTRALKNLSSANHLLTQET